MDGSFILLALLLVFMWAMLILPQQRRQKRHAQMVASLEVGEEILTTAGIYGTITDIFDGDLFLEVSPGVEIRIASGAVAMKIDFEDESADTDTDTVRDEGDD